MCQRAMDVIPRLLARLERQEMEIKKIKLEIFKQRLALMIAMLFILCVFFNYLLK